MSTKKISGARKKLSVKALSGRASLGEPSARRVHFVGIGGIGMSSLARYFLAQNWLVTGSDAEKGVLTKELTKEGIKVHIGHKATNMPKNASFVVKSAAIPADNEELVAATSLNIPIKTYSETLGGITKDMKTVAICGSHGKSTTTAMVASIFIKAKMDPTVVIGTKLNGWNFRSGKSEWLIIEADEYTGAFWNYHPDHAICVNIDLEHIDFYKNLTAVKASFKKFLTKIPKGGVVVMNKDNDNSVSVSQNIKNGRVIFFSSKEKARIEKLRSVLKVPGAHNVMNALAAWHLAESVGIDEKTILSSLSSYKGVWRRLELKGSSKSKGYKIFDDYAHHPTEIKASLSALKEKYHNKYLVCVFQPHQSRRLIGLYKDFVGAFSDADSVFLFDVYNPKGRDEISKKYNSQTLAKDIPGNKAKYISSGKDLKKMISKMAIEDKVKEKNMVVVLMGAGTITDLAPSLLK